MGSARLVQAQGIIAHKGCQHTAENSSITQLRPRTRTAAQCDENNDELRDTLSWTWSAQVPAVAQCPQSHARGVGVGQGHCFSDGEAAEYARTQIRPDTVPWKWLRGSVDTLALGQHRCPSLTVCEATTFAECRYAGGVCIAPVVPPQPSPSDKCAASQC